MIMDATNDIDWNAAGELEVLTFELHCETFAVEAMIVREILDLLPVTAVPGANALVDGVVNFRGKIIPIADLRPAFGFPAAEPTVDSRIVVIELTTATAPIQIGIRADKVHEVATLRRESSEPAPAVGLRWRREFIRGMVRRPDSLIVLPDLGAIFNPLLGGRLAPGLAAAA